MKDYISLVQKHLVYSNLLFALAVQMENPGLERLLFDKVGQRLMSGGAGIRTQPAQPQIC